MNDKQATGAAVYAGHAYRPEIDGLRAIAVLAVVFYHAFPERVPGGFTGVDVFFVISGYLISGVLFQKLSAGAFSFVDFYIHRIKRIFPALVLVLLACLIFGWMVLLKAEYRELGKHVAGGAGFVANLVLWQEAGYFDALAETKPLLHLWSLGIEEQYYLVWPVLLFLGWRKNFNLLSLALLLCGSSYALDLAHVRPDPVGTFYSPLTRVWELIVGSILAWWATFAPPEKLSWLLARADSMLARILFRNPAREAGATLQHVAAFAGVAMIAYGMVKLNKNSVFPNSWALFPVLGAACVILGGGRAYLNRVVLSSRPFVWFGLISYPLYLWHWPLLSFARVIHNDVPNAATRGWAVALAVLLAWLTFVLIEKPIRTGGAAARKSAVLLAMMVVTGALGYVVFLKDGLPGRQIVQNNATLESGSDGGMPDAVVEPCTLPDAHAARLLDLCIQDRREPPRFAIIGDSKAGALAPAAFRTSQPGGRWILLQGFAGERAPEPVISSYPLYRSYQPAIRAAVQNLNAMPSVHVVVIVAATRALFALHNDSDIEDLPASPHYGAALDGLSTTVRQFVAAGKKVILVVDNPTLPRPEDCLVRSTGIGWIDRTLAKQNPRCIVPLARYRELAQQYRKLLSAVQAEFPGDVRLLDTEPYLCDENAGICEPQRHGRALYGITDHISDYAAGIIAKDLQSMAAGL